MRFGEVDDVESDFFAHEVFVTLNGEIEPLMMSPGVSIDSHEKVVLSILFLDDSVKVT